MPMSETDLDATITRYNAAAAKAVAGIRRSADAWREVERSGEDMTRHRNPFTNRLTSVAEGLLSPLALLRYSHLPGVLDALTGITVDAQDKVAASGYCVATVRDSGETYEARPDDMTSAEIKRVFGDGKIRTVAEQRKWTAQEAAAEIATAIRAAAEIATAIRAAPEDRRRESLAFVASAEGMANSAEYVANLLLEV
jgi:hypothetical protein